jgi:hypothetical protein
MVFEATAWSISRGAFCVSPKEVIWSHVEHIRDTEQKARVDALCARFVRGKVATVDSE